MSTNTQTGGEEQPAREETDDTDEWVEERREELERLADSDHNSAWVAEKILQSEDEGDS